MFLYIKEKNRKLFFHLFSLDLVALGAGPGHPLLLLRHQLVLLLLPGGQLVLEAIQLVVQILLGRLHLLARGLKLCLPVII